MIWAVSPLAWSSHGRTLNMIMAFIEIKLLTSEKCSFLRSLYGNSLRQLSPCIMQRFGLTKNTSTHNVIPGWHHELLVQWLLLQLLEVWDTNDSEGSILLCLDPFVSFLCLVKHKKKKYLTAGSTIILRYFPMEKMEKANLESFTILEKNNENSNNDISWIR